MRLPNPGGEISLVMGATARQCPFYVSILSCMRRIVKDQGNRTPYDWDGNTLTAHFTQDLGIIFETVGDDLCISSISSL